MSTAIEAALRRHRTLTIAALAALTLLAWAWLVTGAGMAHPQSRGDMGGMAMAPEAAWTATRFALTMAMWWVMMAAMMLPSAAPTILLYARAATHGAALPASGSFLFGYLAAWGGFSLLATLLQLGLEQDGLIAAMGSASRPLSAAILIAAGLYQLSPLKDACLRQCRSPAQFLSRNYRPGRAGAVRMGLLHGSYCVGCCWLLMVLLFVGGVMNLAWIALLTLLVAAEKLLPHGKRIATAGGVALLVAGAWLLVG
jgi:predicted metal-binding membrane protein